MWEQYRKTLLATQLFILTLCAILLYKQVPFTGVLGFFVVMQAAALIGAKWAARLKRKVLESQSKDDLPLRPR
jgi:hypothetical protein